ncbi:hypothetical protein BDZ97DRAFT_1601620, partial [Flammula alnicola]
GEVVRLKGVFDDGAMANAIDAGVFGGVKDFLSALIPSRRRLRMADGRVVPSLGMWIGVVWLGDVERRGAFEVFDSNGAWAVLFGKPLLSSFAAVHDYGLDVIHIPAGSGKLVLAN